MKTLIFSLMFLTGSFCLAQVPGAGQEPVKQLNSNNLTEGACFICADDALFSNSADLNQGGGYSDVKGCYTCYDNFSGINAPIGEVVFWGFNTYFGGNSPCTPESDLVFEVIFHENNSGNIGDVVSSFELTPEMTFCTNTGLYGGSPVYTFRAVLPQKVTMEEGWLTIRAVDGSDACIFVWAASIDDDQFIWQSCYDNFSSYGLDFAFCLLPGEEDPGVNIPLSGWALGLGIFMIVALAVFRLRRTA
jgi:hypothetical protein